MGRRSVVLVLALCALAACDRAPTGLDAAERVAPPAEASLATTAATRTICASQAVPNGFVVVSARNSAQCGAIRPNRFNQYVIAQPVQSPTWVCSVSPIPAGWVIRRAAGANDCPESLQFGWTQNRYEILWLTGGAVAVCSLSPVPAGWLVIQASRRPECPESRIAGQPQNVYVVTPPNGTQMSICRTLSATPAGWAVVKASTGPSCPDSREPANPTNVYQIVPFAGQQMTVCSVTTIPKGWTVTARSTTSACPPAPRGQSWNTVSVRRA